MTELLLSLHVIAAIVCVGPVTVAASLFPRYARAAASGGGPDSGAVGRGRSAVRGAGDVLDSVPEVADPRGDAWVAAAMHRITRIYAVLGVSVPVFGFATAASLGVLGDAWLAASIVLTAAAAGVLIAFVLPGQERLMVALWSGGEGRAEHVTRIGAGARRGPQVGDVVVATKRLAGATGAFNLLWAVVVVLMIVRPGSTTGG